MSARPSSFPRTLRLLAALFAVSAASLQAQPATPAPAPAPVEASAPATPAGPPLFANPALEIDSDNDGWPDGWARPKEGSEWLNEEGNRFIRLSSTAPGKMVMLYQEVAIPAGVGALELSWRQRVTGIKPGKQPWFDARIMIEFADEQRAKVKPAPAAPNTRRDTAGWADRSIRFLVPEKARMIQFMPCLFQVEAGTYDLDDIVLRPIDPAPVAAAESEAARVRAEKLAAQAAARQAKVAASLAAGGAILTNGNFEKANKAGNAPADWGKAGVWGTDEDTGNRFLRLQNTEPGKTVMSFRTVTLPTDTQALELSLRWRITGLRAGEMPWHDARIMMDIKDAAGKKLSPAPGALFSRNNTKDGAWVERSTSFLVPEGAVTLDLMPSLFQVKSGTFDLDDIVLKPIDPAPVIEKQKAREAAAAKARVPVEQDDKSKWPPAIRAEGNRLVTIEGGKEVWLQGVNVPSLEWSVGGEQVHKSVVVGLDEWKGNVIRLPVNHTYWFGRKGQTDGGAAYRAIVDQCVTLAANRGAYLVLDLHTYRAPRDEYLEFWKDAAARYKNHPALIFDLMNEPFDTTWEVWRDGGFVGEKLTPDQAAFLSAEEKAKTHGFQSPGMQKMLDTVRDTGAMNMVLVGGLDYAYRLDGIMQGYGLNDPKGQGIIYACHIYPWKSQWQKMLLDAAAKYPILLGEVGADAKKMTFMPLEQQEDWETWVPDMLGLIQQHRLNWTAWCFHPGASPRMLLNWDYEPTPWWGQQAKDALHGKQFPPPSRLR